MRIAFAAAACAAASALAFTPSPATAQQAAETAQVPTTTRPIDVTAPAPGSLTVPSVDEAREVIQRTPGGVNVVPAEQYREGRTISLKDMLDYTPGVYAQPRWAEEVRLSIRGSGLFNNNHLSGLRLLQDGIPFNQADGSGDFQELDPLATRYTEVYRGANALQYGSAYLGGAINLVSPTGYDASPLQARLEVGSYDYSRYQVSSGGRNGNWDYYATPTLALNGGFRNLTDGDSLRLSTNTGYRFNDTAETRFYVFGNNIKQRVPGSLTRAQALSNPRQAAAANIPTRAARDIDSVRLANKTSFLVGATEVTTGAYATDRELYHPLSFAVINQDTKDYGAFLRTSTEGTLAGHKNRVIVGGNLAYGEISARQYANISGLRGALQRHDDQTATNLDAYVENQFYALPSVALIAGGQAVSAGRKSDDRFLSDGNDSGRKTYQGVSPKVGVLWEASKDVQVFSNLSRSYEPPRFSNLNPSSTVGFANLNAQRATTLEIGTRGRVSDIGFDVALYRARVDDELQVFSINGSATTVNANRTMHQGIELGVDVPLVKALFVDAGPASDSLRWRQIYNYSDFRFDGDPTFGDNRLPVIPQHVLRGELRYDNGSGFYVGPNYEWVPMGFFVDNANTASLKSEGYLIFGAKAGYRLTPNISFFMDGRNLANKIYIADSTVQPTANATQALYNPGEGRMVFGGVEIRW